MTRFTSTSTSIAWTRRPGHDVFWSYREQFRAFLPPPGAATLEVGCGEGRIARELVDLGHRVTVVELAPTMLAAARDAESAAHYVRGDAGHLPFADDVFDRVVAYNVLMDVADMDAAVSELGRVVAPGGAVTISITHPFFERGRFAGREPDAAFVVGGSYFGRLHYTATEARDGLAMSFAGWSYPLADYVRALREAGLTVVDLVEPRPDPARPDPDARWDRVPLFCWLTAARLASVT